MLEAGQGYEFVQETQGDPRIEARGLLLVAMGEGFCETPEEKPTSNGPKALERE